MRSAELYGNRLTSLVSQDNGRIVFLLLSIFINFFSFLMVIPVFLILFMNQRSIMMDFLEIPKSQVKKLYSKCESFSTSLAIGDEEQDSDLDEFLEPHDEEDHNLTGRKRKRKYKWENPGIKYFLIKFMLVILVMEGNR